MFDKIIEMIVGKNQSWKKLNAQYNERSKLRSTSWGNVERYGCMERYVLIFLHQINTHIRIPALGVFYIACSEAIFRKHFAIVPDSKTNS